MGKFTINKEIEINDNVAKVEITCINGVWSFCLYTKKKQTLHNQVIELDEVDVKLPYLNSDTLSFMIKKSHYEIVGEMFCYVVDSFIVGSEKISEDFYQSITKITYGSYVGEVSEMASESDIIIDEDFPEFNNRELYLPITEDLWHKYECCDIVADNAIQYEYSSKAYNHLIQGQSYKDDIVIYEVQEKKYYKFYANKLEHVKGVYNGCSNFTNYTYAEFDEKYSNQANRPMFDEFIYFGTKEKLGIIQERKIIFLRQVEYVLYFFKEDVNQLKLFNKYNITIGKDNLSNLEIITYVLHFYNNGEYDNGLFKKFSSIINDIDESVIDHIANEIIQLRNGIAHINGGNSQCINFQYFDLISEISYLMFLKYIGVSFINPRAPMLHSGTVVPQQINVKVKRELESNNEKLQQEIKSESKVVVEKTSKPVKKSSYKFFTPGHMRKLSNESYMVKNTKVFSKVNTMIKSQRIAIELDGKVNLEATLRDLIVNNADIVYSNANNNYKKTINKHQDKMIIFFNRNEIIIPKKQIKKFT
ncbi:hypothetical protein RZE82_02890 [Mollicutes bacterium LVI A0039]|nr:hypothetical protein RZE82_02890 [Mollicutes bacterium LVI A0039]